MNLAALWAEHRSDACVVLALAAGAATVAVVLHSLLLIPRRLDASRAPEFKLNEAFGCSPGDWALEPLRWSDLAYRLGALGLLAWVFAISDMPGQSALVVAFLGAWLGVAVAQSSRWIRHLHERSAASRVAILASTERTQSILVLGLLQLWTAIEPWGFATTLAACPLWIALARSGGSPAQVVGSWIFAAGAGAFGVLGSLLVVFGWRDFGRDSPAGVATAGGAAALIALLGLLLLVRRAPRGLEPKGTRWRSHETTTAVS